MLQPTFHLAALRGSVTNGTTNTAIAGVPDLALTRDASGNFLSPIDPVSKAAGGIQLAASGGVNISRARINTPSLREIALPYIAPIDTGITVPSPANIADFGDPGIAPRFGDTVAVEVTHSDAAAQIMWALLWFLFARRQQSPGKEYRVRFTAAVAGVVGTWQSGGITLDQVLPGGIYQITGLDVFGTNLIAARLAFNGGGWRPGCLARNAVTGVPRMEFTNGRLGAWGEFNSIMPPQLETYVEAANTTQEGYMDLIKVSDIAG